MAAFLQRHPNVYLFVPNLIGEAGMAPLRAAAGRGMTAVVGGAPRTVAAPRCCAPPAQHRRCPGARAPCPLPRLRAHRVCALLLPRRVQPAGGVRALLLPEVGGRRRQQTRGVVLEEWPEQRPGAQLQPTIIGELSRKQRQSLFRVRHR